jgi:hypothetical protein
MAPTWKGDTSRQETQDERPGRGGRRGPSRRHGDDNRHWGRPPWDFHPHHGHHGHDHRPDRTGRGSRRRERFGDDEFSQGLRRLFDALRAAGRSGDRSRHAAVATMDGATRAIYRLLAEEAEAPADAEAAGAALSPEECSGPSPDPAA